MLANFRIKNLVPGRADNNTLLGNVSIVEANNRGLNPFPIQSLTGGEATIRDLNVTNYFTGAHMSIGFFSGNTGAFNYLIINTLATGLQGNFDTLNSKTLITGVTATVATLNVTTLAKIGRASCRERYSTTMANAI